MFNEKNQAIRQKFHHQFETLLPKEYTVSMSHQENERDNNILRPEEPHLIIQGIVPAFHEQSAPGELLMPDKTPEKKSE